MRADRAHQDGVAVRRLARHILRAHGAARARTVFDDDVGAQALAQPFSHLARNQIRGSASGERHHDADDLVRPGGAGRAGNRKQRGARGNATATTYKPCFHGLVSPC
ncbi:hypothetical protein D3C71_1447120 [compost metagenome]